MKQKICKECHEFKSIDHFQAGISICHLCLEKIQIKYVNKSATRGSSKLIYKAPKKNETSLQCIEQILNLIKMVNYEVIENLLLFDFKRYSKIELVDLYSLPSLKSILKDLEEYIEKYEEDYKEKANFIDSKAVLIKEILELKEDIGVYTMQNLGYEDFFELPESELHIKYSIDQLEGVLSDIKDPGIIEDASQELIDSLSIIKKYENGIIKKLEENRPEENLWRKYTPEIIKRKMPEWNTVDIQEVYDFCAEYVNKLTGDEKSKVWSFYCDLSDIIFSEEEPEEELKEEYYSESDLSQDEMADSIMSLVEMIILPHREVIDRISEKKGNVLFSNVWNNPFSGGLKKEVKDRDSWRCVICESEQNLHVHHKIPRDLGGVNHKDNLVTLCGSCHPAIETADVNHAFAKCFSNFKKNKYKKKMRPDHFKKDKSLLKEEVEGELDRLLVILLNRGEQELASKLTETMNKMEIIFYD